MKLLSKGVFLCLTVLPLAAGLLYCVLYALGIVGLTGTGFTMSHYIAVFKEGYFLKSLGYSAYQAFAGTGLSLVLSFILFYALKSKSSQSPTKTWSALYLPLLMPPMVVAFVFFAFWSNSGFFARILYFVGVLSEPSAFVNIVNGRAGVAVILAHLFLAVPFFTINLFNIYHSQEIASLRQLSASLGATVFQSIQRVEIPLLLKYLKRVVALYFIFMFGAYEIPLLVGSESSRMLSLVVLDKLTRFDVLAKPQAYAMASMYLVLAACMVFFLFSTFQKQGNEKI